jgi:hypothetical protein
MGNLKQALTWIMGVEAQYPPKAESIVPIGRIAWGHIIQKNLEKLSELGYWNQVLNQQVRPALKESIELVLELPEFRPWASDYTREAERLFSAFTAFLEYQAAERSDQISAILVKASADLKTSPTLSRKVIRVYRSIPGLNCVLLGMRTPAYVRDGLSPAPLLAPEEAKGVIEAFLKELNA